MDKKKCIILVVILIVILLIIFNIIKKSNNSENVGTLGNSVVYNETDQTYTIYDENNNEKAVVHSEAEAQKYIDNPDYNPGLPETIVEISLPETESETDVLP
jgi:competence protein ComGC